MQYPDDQLVRLGDRVHLWKGAGGIVVCSLDTNEFSDEYKEEEWSYLQKGVLIASPQVGLIHYTEPEHGFQLICRANS
jgi:hypothetical protein